MYYYIYPLDIIDGTFEYFTSLIPQGNINELVLLSAEKLKFKYSTCNRLSNFECYCCSFTEKKFIDDVNENFPFIPVNFATSSSIEIIDNKEDHEKFLHTCKKSKIRTYKDHYVMDGDTEKVIVVFGFDTKKEFVKAKLTLKNTGIERNSNE